MQFPTSSAEAMTQLNHAVQFLSSTYSEISKVVAPCFAKIEISQSGLVASLNCLKAAWNGLAGPAKSVLVVTGGIALNVFIITTYLLKKTCCPGKESKMIKALTLNGISESNIVMINKVPHVNLSGFTDFLKKAGYAVDNNKPLQTYFTESVMKKSTIHNGEIRFSLSALTEIGKKAKALVESIQNQYAPVATKEDAKTSDVKKD